MANLANQSISSTYDGLIKTSSDNQVPASGVQLLEDGTGNSLALSVGRANNGVTVTGTVNATAFVGDGSGLTGISVSPTLDEVTTNGSTTTNSITIGGLSLTGALLDSNGQAGTSGQVLSSTVTGTDWIDMGGGTDYTVQEISTNTTAVKDNLYVLTASLTLTLPASPATGDKVAVSNMSGTTTPVVARNGNLIVGLAEDLTIDVKNISVEFIYSGATEGWVIFTDSILGYASVSTVDGSGTTNYISKWSDADTLTDSVIYDDGTNVGIGTSSPAAPLDIFNSNAFLIKAVRNLSTDAGLQIGANNSGSFIDTVGIHTFSIQTNATERMRIDSSGNVGIGTSSPTNKLHVIDTVTQARFEGSAQGNIVIAKTGLGGVGLYSGAAGTLGIYNNDASANIARFDSDGLKFRNDTAAANALDDYEEGTFTPELADAVTGGNVATASNLSGKYTKIGNLVHVNYVCGSVNTTGLTSTNDLYFRNLPYTITLATGSNSQGVVRADRLTFSGDYVVAWGVGNSDSFRLAEVTSGASDSPLKVSSISSGVTDLIISFSYFVS